MTDNTFSSFNILSSVAGSNLYKKCIINDCENDGDYFLCCSPINKIRLFCKSCRTELVECGLVDSGEYNNYTKESGL